MLQYGSKQVDGKLPAAAPWSQQWARLIALSVLVGIAYFLAARLSLALLTKPDGVAVFWPASGVAAGVLIAVGPRARLPVAAGAAVATIVANLLGDRTLMGAIVFALCNAGEALLAGWLIEKYFGPVFSLDRLSHVLGILAAAILAAAVSGIGGTAGFLHFHSSTAPILSTWQHWFASDALGILTVAPLMIELATAARKPPPRSELIEGVVALGGAHRDQWNCNFTAAGPLGNSGANRRAVSAFAVARGTLPPRVFRSRCIHHCLHIGLDDNLWHRLFWRLRSLS